MLQMAGNFLKSEKSGDDSKVRDLISGLKAITVRNFEFAQEGQYRVPAEELQHDSGLQLRAPERAGPRGESGVDNKADRETTEIYTKTDQGKIISGFL